MHVTRNIVAALAAYYSHSGVLLPRDSQEGYLSRAKCDFISSRGNAKILVISFFS